MQHTIPKGVFDILPDPLTADEPWQSSDKWQYLEGVLREVSDTYGFREIRTPIFERTELFLRSIGEGTDIVSKEMYTFLDKAERSLTLRPEGTAPTMRALLEKNLYESLISRKLFYIGPMFRYERPQAGRFRQHHQFGAEVVGSSEPEVDAEIIDLLCTLFKRLGLQNLQVMLNSIGDETTRNTYRSALTRYLEPHLASLSQESQARVLKNPLRILDSKSPEDQELLKAAPNILEFLSESERAHFERVQELLRSVGISYELNSRLVRGLDYYNRTVFEITSNVLGSQNSLGGGGRYDGLLASMGGPNLPAVGFGCGLERILTTMLKQNAFFPAPPTPFVFVITLGEEARRYGFSLLTALRHEGVAAESDLASKKIQHGLQQAVKMGASYCLIIGEEELKEKKAQLKDLGSRESVAIAFDAIVSTIKSKQT